MSKFAYWIAQETASEPKRGKPGTSHSVNRQPTACLFGQSPLRISDRLPGIHGHTTPRASGTSRQKPTAHSSQCFLALAEPD
ncbi:hypothetical protein Enr13x_54860 [Stieleria neptunia]|uniref:Uncharacterized protein n=1 Tax=Stieleria neptunia TaxID=2527979 RepID=A0A518HY05_9BACT|nr:hypothetical protein Enr13x_43090 [Stieleria neptunia]QDV45607.1 hypothetical protein Enr13x_54860 [Stieleria neptunia]